MKYVIVYVGGAFGKTTQHFHLLAFDEADIWTVATDADRVVDSDAKAFNAAVDKRYTAKMKECK